MVDPHPIMAMMLNANSFVGKAAEVEDEIRPLPSQFAFGPGDSGILASANTPLEHDFAILRAVNPEEYAEAFPDWEERMLKSVVLCEHFSRDDPEITIGWFSRVKVLPIAQYRYKESRRWLKKGFPEEIPDWAHKYYERFSDALSVHAPDKVPRVAKCPNCKKRDVELRVVRTITYHGRSGQLTIDGEEKFITVTDPEVDDEHIAQLVCLNPECRSTASLTDGEWQLPGISG